MNHEVEMFKDAMRIMGETNASLQAEVEHWKRVAIDPKVMLQATDEGVDIRVRHALVGYMAEEFGKILGDAPNYVAMTVHSATHGVLIVTIQRDVGSSPHELATEYRKRLEAMGVTDLAPLPDPPTAHQPNPIDHPHIIVNALEQRFECRGCDATAPCPEDATASRWSDLCRAFEDLHGGCKPEVE